MVESAIRVGVTERHHGTGPTIRLGCPEAVALEDVEMRSLRGGRYFAAIGKISKGLGWVKRRSDLDIYHAYQRIPVNARRFVLSFDGILPFLPGLAIGLAHRYCRGLLASDACRALLPHSRHALNLLRSRNSDCRDIGLIMKKAEVVYPAVEWQPDRGVNHSNRKLRLLFVGRQFFIKGGRSMLSALSEIRAHRSCEIVVVSSLSIDDWTASRTPEDQRFALEMMRKMGVTHYDALPRSEVLSLMKWSDILLLPSIDETFGFVLLEAMACGAVPVATAIRAIPEVIQDGVTGRMLKVPVDSEGVMVRDGRHEALIEMALLSVLDDLLSHPLRIPEMARAAQDVARSRFSAARLQADLSRIYHQALQDE